MQFSQKIGDKNADIFVKTHKNARVVYRIVTDTFLWRAHTYLLSNEKESRHPKELITLQVFYENFGYK